MRGGRLLAGAQSHQLQGSQAGPAASVICKLEAPAPEVIHGVWANNKQRHRAHMRQTMMYNTMLGKRAGTPLALHLSQPHLQILA